MTRMWMPSFVVASAVLAASVSMAESDSEATQLTGWQLTAPSNDRFEASRDPSVTFDGKPTARLQTSVSSADLASLTQSIDARAYQGNRIRFSSVVKTKGVETWTGIWLRAEGINRPFLAYADTHDVHLQGDSDWTPITIVIDIPQEAGVVHFGLSQEGHGTSWFGPVTVEKVDNNVPLSYRTGARNFQTSPLACSKAAPTGSHIPRHVCYNFRTGRTSYIALPEYVRVTLLSSTRVGTPRGWMWIWA